MTAPGKLTELLRKCHRDELVRIAAPLGVKHEGVKVGTLARAIDQALRRRATNDATNLLLRAGKLPDYPEVLRQVGARMGLEVPADPALAELAIARHQLKRDWARLPEGERLQRWREIGGELPPPGTSDEAVAALERRHPQSFGYFVTRMVQEPIVPAPGCLLLFWLARPRDALVVPTLLEIARLRHAVRHRVTVGIVGSPSSGKDAAMAAIFGIHTGNVDPVAGSTKQVEIRRLPEATALYVVNTPGLGDVVEQVTEEARQVLDHIDLYLYLVNAQGGVQAREKADHAACRARGRPVLVVVNKVDTLRPDDRERFLADCRAKLEVAPDALVAAAFDPLPQLSEAPIGVEEVRSWVQRQLEALGKDPSELPWVSRERAPG